MHTFILIVIFNKIVIELGGEANNTVPVSFLDFSRV